MSKPIPTTFFNHKRIAVVGNAESGLLTMNGKQIDAADLVVRFNWAMPSCSNRSAVGSRCDVMVSAVSICRRSNQRGIIKQWREQFPDIKLACRKPTSLTDWHFTSAQRLSARNTVGAEPSTGIMMLSFLVNSAQGCTIDAYGFDGMRSGVWYRGGLHHSKRHNPRKEQAALRFLNEHEALTFHD